MSKTTFLLAGLPLMSLLTHCGDDLCENAQDVCDAAEAGLSFEADCPDEAAECLASCVVDADDCSEAALARCNEICEPFIAED